MRHYLGSIKKKFWDEDYEIFKSPHVVGGVTVTPFPRRVARALIRHWLSNWQFWIGTLIGVVGLYLAALELAK